jgi:hypothetical protein
MFPTVTLLENLLQPVTVPNLHGFLELRCKKIQKALVFLQDDTYFFTYILVRVIYE